MSGKEKESLEEIEEQAQDTQLEETVGDLKREKAAKKTAFTKVRRCVLTIIQREEVDIQELKDACDELDTALENVMGIMDRLFDRYKIDKDNRNFEKLGEEIEQIEIEYSNAQNRAQKVIDSLSISKRYDKFLDKIQQREAELPLHHMDSEQPQQKGMLQHQQLKDHQESPSVSMSDNINVGQYTPDSSLIGLDMWKQLKKVTIPVFSGDKKTYQSWKATFTACVDNAPATAEYKLLQLRQCLSGEALKAIENLGHSATAYHTAKERLERKFGGHRRQIALYMEEVDSFRPICPGNQKELEKFADLLDITIVNLKEANRSEELNDGLLYLKLQKKLPTSMLSTYHRWIFEKQKSESVESLREWVLQEAEFQTKALEAVYGLTNTRQGQLETRRSRRENPHTYFGRPNVTESGTERQNLRVCKVCSKSHGAWACPEFKQMEIQNRWDCAKKHKLCFRCLGDGHLGQFCNRTRVCGIDNCKEVHHRLLHKARNVLPSGHSRGTGDEKKEEPTKKDDSSEDNSHHNEGESKDRSNQVNDTYAAVTPSSATQTSTIALRTIPVYLKNGIKKIKVNALLDDASTKTYINSDVAAELGLQGQLKRVNISVQNGHIETFETTPVECTIESLDGKSQIRITAFTTERVIGDMKAIDWSMCAREWSHLQNLEFHKLGPRPIVDVLIGLDCADLHFSFRDIRGAPGQPVARLTPLGWTCIGPVRNSKPSNANTNFAHTYFAADQTDMEKINSMLQKFWQVDTSGIEPVSLLSHEDKLVLNMAEKSIKYNDCSYEIAIPWKEKSIGLQNNFEMAEKRLHNLEKRLLKEPRIAQEYGKAIGQYLTKGYVTKVSTNQDCDSVKWYLPHFPVVREDRSTTKVRIVFDASARYNDTALNDVIYQGPKLQNDLFNVLLRFRRYPVALICDIAEMYLRIKLNPKDRSCHRFLWRDMNIEQKPLEYEFNRLVFGVNSSPILAQFVSQYHAKVHKQQYPRAAETILDSTYMDDSMISVRDETEGVELYKEISELWQKAGMQTHKWLSNSLKVLENIPQQDRASEVNLDCDVVSTVKTLGILWISTDDVFTFKSDCVIKFQPTKRNFLKRVVTLFDPLGMLSPFIIRAKVLMQEIWVCGLDWDDPLPEDLSVKMMSWFAELSMLSKIRVPRCLQLRGATSTTLHVFVDASQNAYGAVVYMRSEYIGRKVSLSFVTSKTKVAPLQSLSIPRLELMAAILGKRLALSIAEVLSIDRELITFWTDSTSVIWWIRGYSRQFKPFIANRIGEIQTSTNPEKWRYVPTKENPADYLTRGTTLIELSQLKVWWEGPTFLSDDKSNWPQLETVDKPDSYARELKRKHNNIPLSSNATLINVEESVAESWRLYPNRFSSWRRLTRVVAWVLRFINNCKQENKLKQVELSIEEISDAENYIIKEMQRKEFKEEYSSLVKKKELPTHSKLLGLCPKLDSEGVIRSDGRLTYAEFLPYDVRYPIILPRKSWITKLIVKHHHELGNHTAGTNQTLSSLSTRFWIIAAREAILEWEKECSMCQKRKAKVAQQIMAPLPLNRLTTSLRAFSKVAVDFGGPFMTIQGRGKPRHKRYLCLFTCLASRAVHLEMAYGLDVDSFLNALNRMINRRGVPEEILSDNGTNFVAANNELCELICKDSKVQASITNRGIKWIFNPPYAPHFGGVFEIMIKSAKRAIVAILNNADVKDEELMIAFSGAEALINSRPLTYQSANVKDNVPITPNHFLHGQIGGQFAPEVVDEVAYDPKKRWRRVQELVRHFWHRWLREWIPSLSPRQKWFKVKKDIKPGDIVLVVSPNTPRGQWPLGRILEVHPAKDGHIRSVRLQVGEKQYSRPIVKVCPLEFE